MKKILFAIVAFIGFAFHGYSQRLVLDASNNPVIVCDDMPAASVTTIPKELGLGRSGSQVAQTVFRSFRVAKQDCWESDTNPDLIMNWTYAASVDHLTYHENWADHITSPDMQTGCSIYYENTDKSDKGSWRLPNQRELMLMFIFKDHINKITGNPFVALSNLHYWSATEPTQWGAMIVNFQLGSSTNSGKNIEYKYNVRCVKEVPMP